MEELGDEVNGRATVSNNPLSAEPEDTAYVAVEYVFKIDEWRKLEHTIGVQEFGVASVVYTNLFLLEHSMA